MSVTFTDNSAQYLAQFERACQASLEAARVFPAFPAHGEGGPLAVDEVFI